MSKCPASPKKRRVSRTNKGHPADYRGIRGHSWKKDGLVRICTRCNLKKESRGGKIK